MAFGARITSKKLAMAARDVAFYISSAKDAQDRRIDHKYYVSVSAMNNVVPQLHQPSPASPTVQRRAFPRRRPRGKAKYSLEMSRPGRERSALLVDISQAGIGLIVGEPLSAGARLEIQLLAPLGQRVVRIAEVRWATILSGDSHQVGCCFVQRLSYAELQLFVR
jgi:PilZ domain